MKQPGRFHRRLAAAALAFFYAFAPVNAQETYPARPVSIVVPFAPGGGADILARVLGQKLSETWRQPVLVENKPGAAGVVGANGVARSDADGYTVLMAASGAIVPANAKDLAPVTLVAAPPYMLLVNAAVPVATTREFIAYLKARPGQLNFASSGVGSASHLSAELFMGMTGTKMTHVPYKGIGQAVTDLVSGQVQVLFGPPPAVLKQVQAGVLKALAVTGSQRSPLWPEIPTVAEGGVTGYEAVGWYGLLAPAKTPREVVAKIGADVARALQVPVVNERLTAIGATPAAGSPEEFARFLEADTAKWAALMAKAGITPQ
jgi:tripartite-type tricarboxylate transporter receptor subunit TctC